MAWFDLKNATISVVDGFSGTATVNLLAGYITGVTTMAIDGYTGLVPIGTSFYTADPDVTYRVTAQTPTGDNTTSITFTPGLAAGVADDAVLTFVPRQVLVKVGEGNLTYSEKQNVEYKKDRGRLGTVRLGDEEPVEVSFEFWWEFLKANTGDEPSMEDILKQRGEASAWVSTATDECEPYCVDIVILYTPPCADQDPEKIELKMFRWESLNHDLKQGMLSVSGKCHVTEATVTRVS